MRSAYLVVGTFLVVAGALGFVQTPLLGLFDVDFLHNLVHIVSGAATLLITRSGIGAMRVWGKLLGTIYLAVALAGWVLDGNLFGLMHVNRPDNVLHLLLACFYLYIGLLAPPRL